jgi:K+-sensing histidine kinase KdpD
MLKRTTPTIISLGIIFSVTAILFYFKGIHRDVQHLVFFYLLPTVFVAILYGSVLSMICALVAIIAAAFFLYDPIYSLYVSDAREVGELIAFAGIGLLGAKCIEELRRPTKNRRA